MGNHHFIFKLLFVLQIICLASAQDLNIVRVGGSNFASVNLYSGQDYTFMGTSGFPYTKEKIIYDVNGQLFTYYFGKKYLTYNQNVSLSDNYINKNFSGLSFAYQTYWISISGNNEFEIYDLSDGHSYYNNSIEYYFGYRNIIEFGSAFEFCSQGNCSYVFPFIKEENNITEYVLFMVKSYRLPNFNQADYEVQKDIKKSKVISCLATSSPAKIICLSINIQGNLTAQIYSETLGQQNIIVLNTTIGDDNEKIY
mgnify:CR=1 FL=1